jgi:hypothetical protein
VPLETDLLGAQKNAMFALGQFAQDVFGTSTVFNGLACVPNTPAAMNVIVQPGVVYAQAALDATAYSSLAADSTVTQKQGILKAAQTFATPAPVTSGQSIVYLISAAFLEADTGATVLPYYNASNPAQAYSGPNNLGTSQNTTRQDTVQLTLTTGVPATTGSQLTPATPAGQTALYTVTVAYGATTVVAANIAKVSGAPFLNSSILGMIGSMGAASADISAASTTLTTAQVGAQLYFNGTANQAVTLPNPASLPIGATYTLSRSIATYTLTVTAFGGASIIDTQSGLASSVILQSGEYAALVWQGTYWNTVGTFTSRLALTAASFLAASGYQKLPSGLIIQWGLTAGVSASNFLTTTFPIAFPTSLFSVVATFANSSNINTPSGGNPFQIANNSRTSFNIYNGGANASSYMWIATGN